MIIAKNNQFLKISNSQHFIGKLSQIFVFQIFKNPLYISKKQNQSLNQKILILRVLLINFLLNRIQQIQPTQNINLILLLIQTSINDSLCKLHLTTDPINNFFLKNFNILNKRLSNIEIFEIKLNLLQKFFKFFF